jgi:hypothetical protein
LLGQSVQKQAIFSSQIVTRAASFGQKQNDRH